MKPEKNKPKGAPGIGADGSIKLPSGKRLKKPAAGLLAKARSKLPGKTPAVPVKPDLKKAAEVSAERTLAPAEETKRAPETRKEIPARILTAQPFSVFIPDEDYNALFPSFYDETRIVLLARDSHWLFTYWEVNTASVTALKSNLGSSFDSGVTLLRVYDVTNVIFDGRDANRFFDVRISEGAYSWYLHAGDPNRRWVAEIGLLLPGGNFSPYARSNTIKTPADSVASLMDEEWAISSELMKRAYPKEWQQPGFGQTAGAGADSGPAGSASKETAENMRVSQGGSENIHGGSSGWLSSWSSPGGGKEKAPLFWLRVGTEIIIYGATEPDATVTMNGKPVKLASDGTFGARFNLTDREHTLTIEARSAGGQFFRAYTIDVTKFTREGK